MKIKNKALLVVPVAALTIATALTGCKKAEKDTEIVLTTPFENDEVFRIDDDPCHLYEVNIYMSTAQNQFESLFGNEIWQKDLGGITLGDQLKDTILARLAQIKVMNLLAEDHGITLDEDEEAIVNKAAAEYNSLLNDSLRKKLDVNEERIAGMYHEYALANKVYNELTKNVNPEISDDEARTITAKHILIRIPTSQSVSNNATAKEKARLKADGLLKQLKEGADFDSLAQKYSDDNQITYSFMKGDMPESFEEAAFNLETDEISDLVETKYGYHIIKCISTFNREETDINKEKIVKEQKNEVFNDIYTDFVSSLYSNLNTELWDSLDFAPSDEPNVSGFFDVYNNLAG